ncbi:MAG TPA: hypothetical protein VM573_10500 [Actinomycetota bacterium]|nr:hypothetical protein [Actinomycetota bacterium]
MKRHEDVKRRSGRGMILLASVVAALLIPGTAQGQIGDVSEPTKLLTSSGGVAPAKDDAPAEAKAEGSSVSVYLGGEEIVSIGNTSAEAGSEGSASDASAVRVLGQEIGGSHSKTRGKKGRSSSVSGYGHETCSISRGVICMAFLHAYTESKNGEHSSSSRSDTSLAKVCVNTSGSEEGASPQDPCEGEVGAEVGGSHSSAQHNRRNGKSKAERSSNVAEVCLGGRNDDGFCEGAGADVLTAQESSDDEEATNEGVSVQLGGGEVIGLDHPGAEDCEETTGPCISLNPGSVETTEGGGSQGDDEEQGVTVSDGPAGGSASATASGGVVRVELLGQEIIAIGQSSAETDDEGSSSDATFLRVLGHKVIGSDAESSGNNDSRSEQGYLMESCEATGGAICVALLYSNAESSSREESGQNGSSSSKESRSDTSGASFCIGGSEEYDPREGNCDGIIGGTVLESHSKASQETSSSSGEDEDGNTYSESSGSSEADQETNGATVCVGGENEDGHCDGIGASVLHAESHSEASSDGEKSNEQDSHIVAVDAAGEEQVAIDQSGDIPPGCSDAESNTVCISLNDNNSDAEAEGGAGGNATVLGVEILSDGDDSTGDGAAGEAGTGADAEGGLVLGNEPQKRAATAGQVNELAAAPGEAQQAFTGAALAPWLALALALIALGAAGLRRGRRQQG